VILDDDPPCTVCGKPVVNRRHNQITCGHPICLKENRRQKHKEGQRRRYQEKYGRRRDDHAFWQPDHAGRQVILDAWDANAGHALSEWDQVLATAVACKTTPAQVISVLRACGVTK